MNEQEKTIADEIKSLGEQAEIAPLLDGVAKMAEYTVKSEKRVNEKLDEIDKKSSRAIEDLDKKIETGFEDIAESIQQFKTAKTSAIMGALRFEDTTASLKSAMTERDKKLVPAFVPVAKSFQKQFGNDSALADPLTCQQLSKWFTLSTKLQFKAWAAQRGQITEDFNKVDKAFADMVVQKASLQEDTTTEGGNLVPTIVEAEIQRLVLDAAEIYPLCRQFTMTKKTHDVPSETTAVTVNWVSEEGTLTQGEPVFGKVTLTANKLAGRARMSVELVEDSNVGLLPWLLSVFTEGMGRELDFQTVEGTTPFTGVNTASNVNSVAATTATAGDALTYPKLIDIYVAGGENSTRQSAIWVMSPAIYGKVLGLVDSNGQPIVKLATVETAPAGTILGRPIVVHNKLGSFTVGSDATGNIYFGPPEKLLFGTRTGFRWDVTDQVAWATYQMDARLVGRFAYVVGVGAAWTKGTKFHND